MIWLKDDLVGDLKKVWGCLGDLRDLVHVGCETWGSRGPRPAPMWRSGGSALVATLF